MSTRNKAYLLSFLIAANIPLLCAQNTILQQQIETNLNELAANQKKFDETYQRIVESKKQNDELLRQLDEELAHIKQIIKKNHRAHNVRIVLYTILVSLGLLLIFLRSYIAKSSRSFSDSQRAAQYALSQGKLEHELGLFVVGTGLVISANGLMGLYKELDIPGQIKKVIKLLKTKEEKKP